MPENVSEIFPVCQPEHLPIFSVGKIADNSPMSEEHTVNPYYARIVALGLAHNPPLTISAIAKKSGVDEGTLRKLKDNVAASPRGKTIAKVAAGLGVGPEALLPAESSPAVTMAPISHSSRTDDEQHDVPLIGSVAGAALGSFVLGHDPIDWLPRPPALRHVRRAYAVYIENDSMTPMHSRGELRFVNPDKPARSGDTVIVQTRKSDGEIQAWIKILEKRTDQWIVCRQLNPAAEVRFARDEVVALHRVLTVAELFNR